MIGDVDRGSELLLLGTDLASNADWFEGELGGAEEHVDALILGDLD